MDSSNEIKLHLGCGGSHKEGYINIDAQKIEAVDLVADITDLSEHFKDNSISLIEHYHVIEHLSIEQGKEALKHWFNLLKPTGYLVFECPDFKQTCLEFSTLTWSQLIIKYPEIRDLTVYNKDITRLHNIYGSQTDKFQFHKAGYWPEYVEKLLTEIGFINITFIKPTSYHQRQEPCLKVRAQKP